MKNFFNFQGRSRRQEFWVTCWLVGLALFVADFSLFTVTGEFTSGWVTMALDLILVAPVSVRRMHDRNKSGWWLLFLLALAVWGQVLQQMAHANPPAAWAMVATLILMAPGLWLSVELAFAPSHPGENRFGPEPQPLPQPAV